ncbi:unnamed protein product [Haemonchus placei]|uniref:Uncharacterized protein n=1 Tax=Haemonchus placei TaxID=6290 RepID=A0A158QPW9_HAEPC|nr:unnamed protein product [Haemonchus placei]
MENILSEDPLETHFDWGLAPSPSELAHLISPEDSSAQFWSCVTGSLMTLVCRHRKCVGVRGAVNLVRRFCRDAVDTVSFKTGLILSSNVFGVFWRLTPSRSNRPFSFSEELASIFLWPCNCIVEDILLHSPKMCGLRGAINLLRRSVVRRSEQGSEVEAFLKKTGHLCEWAVPRISLIHNRGDPGRVRREFVSFSRMGIVCLFDNSNSSELLETYHASASVDEVML